MANEQNLKPFSSTYQPDPKSLRKLKLKSWLRKIAMENKEIFEQKIKEGNYSFWKEALDRGFGKVKETTEIIKPEPLNIIYTPMTKEELKNCDNVEIFEGNSSKNNNVTFNHN